jgi:NAD(P)-dependent dehydrogenase (short-subunit alcohol dehydrogenase family)
VEVVPTDVTDEAQVAALFAHTMRKFGRLDILVNNAGAFETGPLEDLSLETWRKVMDVNLTGVFLCTREAMKIMKRQRGGRIINIGSLSAQMAQMAQMDWAPYVTAKHGLVGLTKSTALEGREFGVAASCLHPGIVATERSESAQMAPEDVAKVALTVATLPPYANMLESIVMPVTQPYLGRG